MLKIACVGHGRNTLTYLKRLEKLKDPIIRKTLEKYGLIGVHALIANTPVDTGKTASSWEYVITEDDDGYYLSWTNHNKVGQVPLVILLQYGHATKSGGYVLGRDFINPAIRPILDEIANDAWKEIINL